MSRTVKTIRPAGGRVVKIKIKIQAKNVTGTLKVTDILLQGGSMGTRWAAHPSEIRWSFDNE